MKRKTKRGSFGMNLLEETAYAEYLPIQDRRSTIRDVDNLTIITSGSNTVPLDSTITSPIAFPIVPYSLDFSILQPFDHI